MPNKIESGRNLSEAVRRCSQKGTPPAIERYLKVIHFPVQKKDLISEARDNGAPKAVMKILYRFEDKEYTDAVDIVKEVAQLE